MILQNLILPQTSGAVKELYFRSEDLCNRFPLELSPGGSVSFAAYFNYFSLSKWRKHAVVDDVHVFVKCRGKVRITVDHHILEEGIEKVCKLFTFESDGDADVLLPSIPETGLLSISLTSLSEGSALFGGGFRSGVEPPNKIRIGIDICTYRRELETTEKIERLNSFLGSVGGEFSDSVELFVIDNGNTLSDSLNSDKVHVIPNKNLGGSGGFARGMMEVSDSKRFTHILLSDDDAPFEPESLYRTWSFLSFIKEEYKDAHIGGAMLMSETLNTIWESGALYSERGRILRPAKKGLDLTDPEACLKFDIEEDINYFGWWYLVIPVSHVTDLGYPLPLFLKWDDIEYGIRKKDNVMITLNGVSVWHDSFKDKFFTSNNYCYYFARNYLVIGCTTRGLKRRDVLWMLRNALFEAVCYRYDCSEMMINGINDFLKGPKFVFDQCINGMVKSIPVDIKKIDELKTDVEFKDPHSIKRTGLRTRMLTMNGLLLPQKRNIETSPDNMDSSNFYRAGKVLYNINGTDGFVAERSIRRTFSAILKTISPGIRTILSFGKLKKRYEESLGEYSSEEHWRNIFDSESEGRSHQK